MPKFVVLTKFEDDSFVYIDAGSIVALENDYEYGNPDSFRCVNVYLASGKAFSVNQTIDEILARIDAAENPTWTPTGIE